MIMIGAGTVVSQSPEAPSPGLVRPTVESSWSHDQPLNLHVHMAECVVNNRGCGLHFMPQDIIQCSTRPELRTHVKSRAPEDDRRQRGVR
eukprot:908630-Rhodomonas_salina.1